MKEKKVLHIFTFTLSDNKKKIQHETMSVYISGNKLMSEDDSEETLCVMDSLDYIDTLDIYHIFPTNKIDRIQLKTFNDTVDIDKFKEPFIKQLTEEIAERKKQLSLLKKLSL